MIECIDHFFKTYNIVSKKVVLWCGIITIIIKIVNVK